jgi:uncharacterized protein (TIGR02246 family)
MIDEDGVRAWIERYRSAWESNDPIEIASLFTEAATYYPRPYATAWRGRDQIVAKWLRHRDEPGDTTFEWRPVSITGDLAVIRGTTTYLGRNEIFSNLWIIRLTEDGRADEFTEWWMQHPT